MKTELPNINEVYMAFQKFAGMQARVAGRIEHVAACFERHDVTNRVFGAAQRTVKTKSDGRIRYKLKFRLRIKVNLLSFFRAARH